MTTMKKPVSTNRDKPFPLRLKELKAPLQQEAARLDRSLHWLILSIIREAPCIKQHLSTKNEQA